jgi:hypothetical protein
MWENRPLTPDEGLLRAGNGSTDLAQDGGWHVLAPEAKTERIRVSRIDLLMTGPALLANVTRFGAATGSLALALHVQNRYRTVHDASGSALHTLELASEWSAGRHQGTRLDPAAGRQLDGSPRAGLRGPDLLPTQAAPSGPVTWTSAPISFRSGFHVERVAWSVDDLRDPSGQPLQEFAISFRIGKETGNGIAWRSWQPVSGQTAAGESTLLLPAGAQPGNRAQWKVELRYGAPSDIGFSERARRTPVVYSLGFWVQLPTHIWRFDSLADLLAIAGDRARTLATGHNGTDDAIVLSLPLGIDLHADPAESIRARFTFDGSHPLTSLRLRAIGMLGFEAPP